ncbi:class I SAM-dependent methyltransferase [Streptomyces sp. NPDC093109]|uniref:class I SAM-dependent methyltransferase n=1 Tax=Streptomyces sp. NPDC093109 TaxID=3154977 RepID=UPI00344F4D80
MSPRSYDWLSRAAGVGDAHWQLVAQAAIGPRATVLEIGAGTGNVLLKVKRAAPGAVAIGLDTNAASLAAAARKAVEAGVELRLDLGDAAHLPYPDAGVDRVLASFVLHHIPDEQQPAVLHEIRRVLKPGGSLHLLDFTAAPTRRPRDQRALLAQAGLLDPVQLGEGEAYAPTKPNSWWHDTYRHAAENVLLTLALAKAEGVTCVCWYQFHDSVLGMPQIADPDNVEYHYGLMNRDLSPKPSLLAYATAARVLDRATFRGHLTFSDPETFGLWFDTPEGPAVVLWNRADGYLLNTSGERTDGHFPAPEVWVDPWPTKTHLTVTAGDAVRRLDSIGRSRQLTPAQGRVTLTLDGSPRVFYGLTPVAAGSGTHTLAG